MGAALILAMMAAGQAAGAVVPGVEKFDLAKVAPKTSNCADAESADDIVVCAKKAMDRPIRDPDLYKEKPVRAKIAGPLNSTVEVQAVRHGTPTASAPAAMVTLKIPL